MTVKRMTTEEDIAATSAAMLQLRPHLTHAEYVTRARRMMETIDYRIAAAIDSAGVVRSVAGYRVFEMLFCDKMMSIDDFVTDETSRSAGFGRELLDWLKDEARASGCVQIHLDSNVVREAAHRFYFRERFGIRGFHFIADL